MEPLPRSSFCLCHSRRTHSLSLSLSVLLDFCGCGLCLGFCVCFGFCLYLGSLCTYLGRCLLLLCLAAYDSPVTVLNSVSMSRACARLFVEASEGASVSQNWSGCPYVGVLGSLSVVLLFLYDSERVRSSCLARLFVRRSSSLRCPCICVYVGHCVFESLNV